MTTLRSSSLALGLLLTWHLTSTAHAVNIVTNPSFEDGGMRGAPFGWGFYFPEVPARNPLQLVKGNSEMFSVDSTTAHDGSRSMRITSQDSVRCSIAQRLPFKVGQKLHVSVWMKGENLEIGESKGALVRIGFNSKTPEIQNKIGPKSLYLKSTTSTFDWTQLSGDVVVPEETEVIALECYLWQGRGTVWFDQISVEVVDGPANDSATVGDAANKKRYRDANAQLPPLTSDEKRVVFIGDSITDNWKLDQSFPGKKFINRGIGGQNSAQVLARFRDDALALKPKVVWLLVGTNDIAGDKTNEESILGNIEEIIRLCQQNNIRLIINSLLPVSDYHQDKDSRFARTSRRPPAQILSINKKLEALCAKEKMTYLDIHKLLADSSGLMGTEYADDGLHPNAAGYAVLTPVVLAAVESALN